MDHSSESVDPVEGMAEVGGTIRPTTDRVAAAIVTGVGEVMLFLGFLAAALVIGEGGEIAAGGALPIIAAIGASGALMALSAAGSGRAVLENWGANISLLASVALLLRLYLPVSGIWNGSQGAPITAFLAGAVALSTLRSVIFNLGELLGRIRGNRGVGGWGVLMGRWIMIVAMAGLLTLVAG